MKITSQQRKALEAAGYTVGKSGTTIQKDGKTVGGYNANGQMFSGSSTIKGILKAKPEAAPRAASSPRAATPKAPTRPRARPDDGRPTAMSTSPEFGKSDLSSKSLKITTTPLSNVRGGRGDGAKERIVRSADAALARNAKVTTKQPTPPRSQTPMRGGTSVNRAGASAGKAAGGFAKKVLNSLGFKRP